MTSMSSVQPVIPSVEEQESLSRVGDLLNQAVPGRAILVGAKDEQTVLPAAALEVLRQAIAELAQGHAVTVMASTRELSTQQAANVLNVSRPYLIQLLEAGKIPFHRVGTHRRVGLGAVLAYRFAEAQRREAILDQMAREAQELGEYGG